LLGFHRDGHRAAGLSDSTLALFEVAAGLRRTGQSSDHRYETNGYDIDPHGKLLASHNYDGLRLWDCATARELARIDTGDTYWNCFRRTDAGFPFRRQSTAHKMGGSARMGATCVCTMVRATFACLIWISRRGRC
jgi:hypothetical protein